jgi:hypothetical protein
VAAILRDELGGVRADMPILDGKDIAAIVRTPERDVFRLAMR